MDDFEFYLVLPAHPKFDVDELVLEILERVGIRGIIGSGTFGNEEGAIQHDFQIVAKSKNGIDLIVAGVVASDLDTTGATLKTKSGKVDLIDYFHQNCKK